LGDADALGLTKLAGFCRRDEETVKRATSVTVFVSEKTRSEQEILLK
jgi:hypothetical protein